MIEVLARVRSSTVFTITAQYSDGVPTGPGRLPGQHWAVGREFNRRIKLRFDELAIQSPMTSYRVLAAALQTPKEADT